MSVTDDTDTHEQSAASAATIWPIGFAFGVAVLLVGLIVNPEVIVPLGGAITVLAAAAWIRGGRQGEQPTTREETAPQEVERGSERYTRNRFLERTTLGLAALSPAPWRYPPPGWPSCPPSSVSGGARSTLDR